MTELEAYGDATTTPFWQAALRHELLVQRCGQCGACQFYPRPFCLSCSSERVEWLRASGRAVIYSITTVHIQVLPDLEPPYRVGVVELEEGPRLLTRLEGECDIGDHVTLEWIERESESLPPLPTFRSTQEA